MCLRLFGLFDPLYIKSPQRFYSVYGWSGGPCSANDDVTAGVHERIKTPALAVDADLPTVYSQYDLYIFFGCMVVLDCSVWVVVGEHFNRGSYRVAFAAVFLTP